MRIGEGKEEEKEEDEEEEEEEEEGDTTGVKHSSLPVAT